MTESTQTPYDIVIAGGGLAGLVNAILLGRAGLQVALVEKKQYPFHRVCGEYISNEVIPFLEAHDLFPTELHPSQIETLQLSATNGKSFEMPLDLGGFGISRFQYDYWLLQKAKESGVHIYENHHIRQVTQSPTGFRVACTDKYFEAKLVISAVGKRSTLDKSLNRNYLRQKSPYVGVKYHVEMDYPADLIGLHNFSGGYCGISKVEGSTYNVCYLIHRDQIKKYGNVAETESKVLFQNPHLKEIWNQANFLWAQPEVINEITFEKKEPVLYGILMSGDAAGMITPLCGNGMAMAIHSAKILSETILDGWKKDQTDLSQISQVYAKKWNSQFERRLWIGRQLQKLFGSNNVSNSAVFLGRHVRPLARELMRLSHGQPFS